MFQKKNAEKVAKDIDLDEKSIPYFVDVLQRLSKLTVEMMADYLSHVRSNPNVKSVTVPIDNGEEITIKLS